MSADDPSAPRVFSYEEACRLVPAVRERTRQALDEMSAIKVPLGDADDVAQHREALQKEAARILASWAADVEALGAEVKGPWLIDFDSGGGYYCWKWPEESLDFFHGYEEGFAGRVRLQ